MKDIDKALTVDVRNGLPDELLELLRKYPRDQWANDARLHGLAEGWLQRHNLFRELSVLIGGMTTDLREGRTSPTTFLPLFQRRNRYCRNDFRRPWDMDPAPSTRRAAERPSPRRARRPPWAAF